MVAPSPKHDVFQAIADPTRRKLLRLLAEKELPITEISSHFPMSRTAVSKHLRILANAELVSGRKYGREKLYRLAPEPLLELKQWLAYYEQFWDNKLSMLKHYVENGGHMKKLFVDKTIEIHAPASKVWDTLTKREYTDQWALEFSSGGPQFHIESDWKLGSPVLWKGQDGTVIVEGKVTALEPNKLLRFTVFDVRSAEKPPVTDEDGISYHLTEEKGMTKLHILQGDFSVMTEGEKYRNLSSEIWDKVLLKVKKLTENEN